MNPAKKDYWRDEAASFSSLYTQADRRSGLKRYAARFLDDRTRLLDAWMDCRPDANVLDLGCGSGVHVKLLAPRCGRITGLDRSEPMIEMATRDFEASGFKNWSFRVGDARTLPFEKDSFDWIVSLGLLDYVPSPAGVLDECHRVMKDGASIIFTIPKSPSLFFFLRTRFGNVIKSKVFGLPPIGNVVSREELEGMLRSAGFELTRIHAVWTTMWIVKATRVARSQRL